MSIILKIAAFIFLAPLIGMVVAFGFTLLVLYICRRANHHTADVWFKKLQLVSSALFSIGHGLNDSQKVMGIIAAVSYTHLKEKTSNAFVGPVPRKGLENGGDLIHSLQNFDDIF